MDFNSLQEVRDFIAQIPEDQFTTSILWDKETGKKCVAGHLNTALHGHWNYEWGLDDNDRDINDLSTLLSKFNANTNELIHANNMDVDNPKRGALEYLDSVLEGKPMEQPLADGVY